MGAPDGTQRVFGRQISEADPAPDGAYVYCYILAGVPRYVGKGSGRRCWDHLRYAHGLNAARQAGRSQVVPGYVNPKWQRTVAKRLREGATIEVRILVEGLAAAEANARERQWIRRLGREDLGTGSLLNRSDGGDGATSEDMKRNHAQPEFKAHHRAAIQRLHADPEFRERYLTGLRLATLRPEARARRKAVAQSQHADPAFKSKNFVGHRLPAADRPRGAALVRLAIEVRGYEAAREALRAAGAHDLDTFRAVLGSDLKAALAGFARRRADLLRHIGALGCAG
ncbi:hypothetical protein GXW78_18120 [Roseomonas terrae]|uniref:GIY-YIG domain-containing protein n=1 Tax=Neoroseomonas terrae TaxID=424799 RepID=A0ABS5EKP7_9PROT|nr:hypothetical protein [Neoroseomonas terrae]MBR0651592.1 hypothetical protein [Neoroseomonas terrae]